MSELNNNGTVEEIKNETAESSTQDVPQTQTQTQDVPQTTQPANPINVVYDSEGRPIIREGSVQNGNYVTPKKTRLGHFIASLVCLAIAIGVTVFSTYYFFATWIPAQNSNDAVSALLFLVYIFSGLGILLAIPSLAFSVASLVCACISVKSSKKAFRIVSGFTIAISIITLLVGLFLPFIILVASGGSFS